MSIPPRSGAVRRQVQRTWPVAAALAMALWSAGALAQLASPTVVERQPVPGALDLARWRTTGPVTLTVSPRTTPGRGPAALRIEVPQTHAARRKRSFTGQIMGFEQPQDWSRFNRLVLPVYLEPSDTPRGAGISVHLYGPDGVRRTMGVHMASRGKWQPIEWDMTPMPREGVTRLMITQGVHRHNPGESHCNVFHFGALELRRVEPETKVRGWELQPHRVAFSHVGYLPSGPKRAVFAHEAADSVRLLDADTGRVVWQGKLQPVLHPRTGAFKVTDFSSWRQAGRYVLEADGPNGPVRTEAFPIGPEVYRQAVCRTLDFYRAERCGDAAPGYHTACHLDDGRVGPYAGMKPERFAPEVRALFGKHVDCSGGWHDAGDMAKFVYQEHNSSVQMFRLFERGLRYQRDADPHDAVLDEARWGAQYALKTLLPTGRDCDRPERVGQGVWTDGVPGNDDDRQVGMTTWQCAERYVAGMMAEAIAARVLRDTDPPFAKRCLEQAKREAEAYLTGAMKNWRQSGFLPLRYSAVGLAFLELYRTTGQERYGQEAARCGVDLVGCQEQSLAWNDLGITGFFYEGPRRRHPFAHSSGDGRPAYLLVELCREFPDHPSWMQWYAGLRIYARHYAAATSAFLAPYGLPAFSLHDGPSQSYPYWDRVSVIGQKGSQKLDFQFEKLVRVGRRYLVRLRNANSSLPMQAATLAGVADVARDPEADAMAHRCFQWLLGRNPFSRSQVWAVGHRYREQPHYVATHDLMPGSIPCKGIDGRLDGDGQYHDEPFSDPLPRCVINEVCIAQAAYFLNAGRDLAFSPVVAGKVQGAQRPDEVVARFAGTTQVAARAPVRGDGAYQLVLPGGGTYDLQFGPVTRRHFVATAARLQGLNVDTEREVEVRLDCPKQLRPGKPVLLRVVVQRLDKAARPTRHGLSLRLHNVDCPQPSRQVTARPGAETAVTFRLVPKRACEPFVALVVPDGQLDKRGEVMGVVGGE